MGDCISLQEATLQQCPLRYGTALMQCFICTTLFLSSASLLERSIFAILEKTAKVPSDTRSRSFHKY